MTLCLKIREATLYLYAKEKDSLEGEVKSQGIERKC